MKGSYRVKMFDKSIIEYDKMIEEFDNKLHELLKRESNVE